MDMPPAPCASDTPEAREGWLQIGRVSLGTGRPLLCRARARAVRRRRRRAVDQWGRLLLLNLGVLGLRAVIVGSLVDNEAVRDADDEEEPEEVEGLEGRKQCQGDPERERALVLARLPVELIRADGLVLVEKRVDDTQVKEVAKVDPRAHEDEKVRAHERVVDVVEDLGRL